MLMQKRCRIRDARCGMRGEDVTACRSIGVSASEKSTRLGYSSANGKTKLLRLGQSRSEGGGRDIITTVGRVGRLTSPFVVISRDISRSRANPERWTKEDML